MIINIQRKLHLLNANLNLKNLAENNSLNTLFY